MLSAIQFFFKLTRLPPFHSGLKTLFGTPESLIHTGEVSGAGRCYSCFQRRKDILANLVLNHTSFSNNWPDKMWPLLWKKNEHQRSKQPCSDWIWGLHHNMDPILANAKGTKNLWIDREGLNTIILLNRYIIKTTSNDLLFYPLIRASLNPHQRSSKRQWT